MSPFSILIPFSRTIPPKHAAVITSRRKTSAVIVIGAGGVDTGKGRNALGMSLDCLYGPCSSWVEVVEVAVEGGRDEKGASPETSDLLVFKA